MQHFRGQQGDAAVMMFVVVPGKELLAKGPCVFDAGEAVGELRPVLERLELALRERVVVGDVRPAVGLGDPQVASSRATGLEVIDGPRSLWIVRVAGNDALFCARLADQPLGQVCAFAAATIQPTT